MAVRENAAERREKENEFTYAFRSKQESSCHDQVVEDRGRVLVAAVVCNHGDVCSKENSLRQIFGGDKDKARVAPLADRWRASNGLASREHVPRSLQVFMVVFK